MGAESEADQPRLPFQPKAMRAGETEKKGNEPVSVTTACSLIDAALRRGVESPLRVIGEISGFNDRSHWYFSLKDDDSVLSCVMFAGRARTVKFRPENGQEIVATGRVEHYSRQGRTQLYVDSMQPVGVGALELEFQRLCATLRDAGYFDESKKKPLPAFPRRIAVVTSKTSAALQDVIDTLRRRAPFVEILVADVRVQGENASAQIARTIDSLSNRRRSIGIDTIILTRGGGSMEDLWAFNERPVADAILRCEVPIIGAIGHETDTTIAELVADVRAATPTQAALRASPDTDALLEQIDRGGARLHRAVENQHESARRQLRAALRSPAIVAPLRRVRATRAETQARTRRIRAAINDRILRRGRLVDQLAGALAHCRPEAVLARRHSQLASAQQRMTNAMQARIDVGRIARADSNLRGRMRMQGDRHRTLLLSLERSLRIAGPPSVLKRGYSITQGADGRVLTDPEDSRPNEKIRTRLRDGVLYTVVEPELKAPRKRAKPDPSRQFNLFGED